MTLSAARAALASGVRSPESVLEESLGNLEASEPVVRAWRFIDREGARAQARALDPADRAGLPLWGVPVGIKDIIDVAGMPTSAASALLAGNIATSDAPAVAALRAAGAVILGKTNTQEFAYGAVSPPTTNPWDPSRIPGGSSGGSAAALAAGHCLGALGTDTSGSIRIPAALCGVAGLKPRPRLVSLQGVIPLAPSLDALGPMARTAQDLAILWAVLSPGPVAAGRPEASSLRVAAAPLNCLPELEPDVFDRYGQAVQACARLTRYTVRAEIPAFADFDRPRAAVQMWEALQVHRGRGWWPDRAEEYTEETRGYLAYAEAELTEAVVSAAREECAALAGRLRAVFDHVDVLVSPTVPCPAPTHAEGSARAAGQPRRPVVMKLTRIPGPVNVAGLAAVSVPCGLTSAGLPVGLQLIGTDEAPLLGLAQAFEQAFEQDGGLTPPTPPTL